MDLPIQWLEQYGLPHDKKVSSVDAIIYTATHSGSHSSHGPTYIVRAIACHTRQRECNLDFVSYTVA